MLRRDCACAVSSEHAQFAYFAKTAFDMMRLTAACYIMPLFHFKRIYSRKVISLMKISELVEYGKIICSVESKIINSASEKNMQYI